MNEKFEYKGPDLGDRRDLWGADLGDSYGSDVFSVFGIRRIKMPRYIDADKLSPDCMFNKNGTRGFAISQSQIANAPTADVQPVIHANYIDNGLMWSCSNCGASTRIMKKYKIPNYCPCCGAKMVEPQESEVDNG